MPIARRLCAICVRPATVNGGAEGFLIFQGITARTKLDYFVSRT